MADTKISALTAVATPAATDEFAVNQSGTSKKETLAQIAEYLFKRINGNSGAAGEYKTLQKLSANSSTNTSTTPAVVMTTTGVGPGTWHFKYTLIYQTAATTTGIGLCVNHTGTTGQYTMQTMMVTTGGAAATGVGDGVSGTNAGQLVEGKSERAINTVTTATAGVDTANADCQVVLQGFVVVTVSGSLELKMSTEVATSGVTMQADSMLELTKVG